MKSIKLEISDLLQEAIVSYFEGELTQVQADELLVWVNQSKENKYYFRQLAEIWHTVEYKYSSKEFKNKDSLAAVKRKIKERGLRGLPEKEIRLKHSTLLRIAAGLLLLISLGIAGRFIFNGSQPITKSSTFVETYSPKGSRSMITLADGSTVWLNAGTKLRYPIDYGYTNRNVFLEGEAYFQVAKNKKIPFVVNASDITVTALGTAFNVKAYKDEETIETTIEEGKVRIESMKDTKNSRYIKPVILKPSQNAVYLKLGSDMTDIEKKSEIKKTSDVFDEKINPIPVKVITVPDTRLFTSWKDSRWIFKNERLSTLAPKLERRYDVNIVFTDSILQDYAFTGNLKEESIEQVLQVISISAPIQFKIDSKLVRLYKDKKRIDNYQKILKP